METLGGVAVGLFAVASVDLLAGAAMGPMAAAAVGLLAAADVGLLFSKAVGLLPVGFAGLLPDGAVKGSVTTVVVCLYCVLTSRLKTFSAMSRRRRRSFGIIGQYS